jgi:hypothetical protein
LSMSLNFIKAWRNDKWYNKRVMIWHFTLVLIKINYGQIGDQTGLFYRSSMLWWSSRTLTKLKLQFQKCFNERKNLYLKYKNKNHSGTDT